MPTEVEEMAIVNLKADALTAHVTVGNSAALLEYAKSAKPIDEAA